MSRYDYPQLPRNEIIGTLADFQIAAVSDADLLHPNPDLISQLYTRILIRIDCLQEDHGQVDFAALEQLENPDLHIDSVRMMNLFHKIREVIAAVDCPKKFTLKDLIKPDPARTELFLSALLNFFLHNIMMSYHEQLMVPIRGFGTLELLEHLVKDTRMNALTPFVEELNLLDEKRQELEARISQLNADIAEHNESREREIPLVQEVDAKVKGLRQAISGLNNHQVSLKASIIKLKETTKELDEKISSAELAKIQSSQENANLLSKIVQSPDKLQGALEEKKSIQIEAKNAERAAMQSFHEKSAILEVYTKAKKKLTKHYTQMQALQEQVNAAKKIEKDVKILKAKLSDDAVLDKSLEAKIVERQGRLERLEDLQKQLEKERDLSREEGTIELKNVTSQVESKRRELESRQRNIEAMVTEGDAINAKIVSVKESATAKQQDLGRKCEEIVKEFYQYSNAMGHFLSRIEVEPEVLEESSKST